LQFAHPTSSEEFPGDRQPNTFAGVAEYALNVFGAV
jgi:hypothetical protein